MITICDAKEKEIIDWHPIQHGFENGRFQAFQLVSGYQEVSVDTFTNKLVLLRINSIIVAIFVYLAQMCLEE